MKEIIPFVDEHSWKRERLQDLTSSADIPALFGVSPYRTVYETWLIKHGMIEEGDADNERTEMGKALQDSIAAVAARRNEWNLRRMDEYIRETDARIGASFDFCQQTPGIQVQDYPQVEVLRAPPAFLVEVKNVDGLQFKQNWIETDFGLEAPAAIELQAQAQMLVSGVHECRIVALVGGNKLHVLPRQFDDIIGQRILDLAAWFWSLKEAPAPDYARDYEVISRLHGYSSAGKVIEASPEVVDLAAEYRAAAADYSAAEKRKKVAKARLLELIGDAERVESPEYVISAKEVKPCEIAAYTRDGFRGFRINERSSK